jgi:hypothetical protein
MDPILNNDTPAPERAAAVQRLRRQVRTGAYTPPVEALVERLVSILVGDSTVGRRTLPSQAPRRNGTYSG